MQLSGAHAAALNLPEGDQEAENIGNDVRLGSKADLSRGTALRPLYPHLADMLISIDFRFVP
jgi:hypothetical protein